MTRAESTGPPLPLDCRASLDAPAACSAEYFPGGLRRLEPDAGGLATDHFARHLRAFGEPSLSAVPPDVAVIRFLWLRSFHPAIVVRLQKDRAGIQLVARRSAGPGGYAPQGVAEERVRAASPEEWASIESRLDPELWSDPPPLPPREPAPGRVIRLEEIHLDGADWILEAAMGGRHRPVHQWSPTSGLLRDLCLELVRLAGLPMERVY